jgi:tRNA nucleotidyltransferase (CCA-adding enzyme)
VFRGIRLEQRLRFRLEENSLRLLQNCVKGGLITLLSGFAFARNLRRSSERISLSGGSPSGELGVWEMLFPGLLFGTGAARCLRRIGALFHRIRRDLPDFGDDLWLASLAGLLEDSPEKVRRAVPDRLHLAPRERMIVERALFRRGAAEHELGGRAEKSPSEIVAFLRDVPNATTLCWAGATERWRVRRRILVYLPRLCRVRPMLTGRDLLDLGYRSGPHIGDILEGLLRARLEGDVETREEEIRWVLTQHPLGKVERVSRQGISRH